MHPFLSIAIRAAREASDIIIQSMDRIQDIEITEKGHNDFVTEVDTLAEQVIIDNIRKSYPDHGFIAEESGEDRPDSEFVWVIDPLDGTTNFIRGIPHFAISIGVKQNGKMQCGLIYDPLNNEMFTATKGAGAQLNNRRIRVTKQTDLNGALLGTGFPYRHHEMIEPFIETFRTVFPQCAGMRRAGSAALDLAYVAAGRLDGYWEYGLKPWDIAAGSLIVKEAGGLVGDFDGSEKYFETGNIVAGNPKVFKFLVQALGKSYSGLKGSE